MIFKFDTVHPRLSVESSKGSSAWNGTTRNTIGIVGLVAFPAASLAFVLGWIGPTLYVTLASSAAVLLLASIFDPAADERGRRRPAASTSSPNIRDLERIH